MVNGAGAIFHCTYILIFLIYSPQDKKVKRAQLVGIFDVGFVASVISVTLFLHGTTQLNFLGTLCSGLSIIMYASPLLTMKMVLETKSNEYMPFLDSFFMFINAGVWTLYSFLINDLFILIPSFIGLILGLAQITFYMIYKQKPISSNVPIIEIETFNYNKDAMLKDEAIQVVKKALKRVKSLPGPILDHRDTLQKLLKTLSFEPDNLSSSTWINLRSYDEDDIGVEIGVDIEEYPNHSSPHYQITS
ncbi:putative SWEET sugar transporter [Lupinus albus]|uniref:Bidirectional sugar transporter SWEET n=1 Tax=Lupinus albus TaxID=3870 RepID=A0A6A4P011_LUPAL|nr:putative SWEET sugar transporter [Lupinus albus]